MYKYFDNWVMSFQANRLLAEIPDGGGSFEEAERAMARMTDGGFESWYREWMRLGDEIREIGDEAEDPITSRDAYLRSTNYYRSGNFFLDQDSERGRESYTKQKRAFRDAVNTGTLDAKPVSVEAEDGELTGYYFPTSAPDRLDHSVTLLVCGGADSTKEECFFMGVPRARERGLSCLVFDGYGQGDAIRERDMYSRPDWEVSVSPFIDWIEAETDTDRLGLLAASLGGYYGGRAAACEDRLDAVSLWSACHDVIPDVYDYYPEIQGTMQWLVDAGSDAQARERLAEFTLDRVDSIDTELLIVHGNEDSIISPEAAKKTAAKASNSQVRMWEGAEHCTVDDCMASTTFMIDWLTDALA